MARVYEIKSAFSQAVYRSPKGYLCVKTSDFVRQLAAVNWHFTRADANAWIEREQPEFLDKTTTDTDDRFWILRNMGRIR